MPQPPEMPDDEQPPGGMVNEAAGPPPQDMQDIPRGAIREGDEPPEGEQTEGGGEELADQVIESLKQHTPPEFKGAVERLVLAGMKAMFSPEMNAIAMKEVERNPDDPAGGAATGVAALMSQLATRSQGRAPPPALTHAALILLMEALKFLAEAGRLEITAEIIDKTSADLSAYMMQKLGLTPDKVAEAQDVMRQAGGKPIAGGAPPAPGGAPPGPPAAGLIGRATGG